VGTLTTRMIPRKLFVIGGGGVWKKTQETGENLVIRSFMAGAHLLY
jgi:hypothetical protein